MFFAELGKTVVFTFARSYRGKMVRNYTGENTSRGALCANGVFTCLFFELIV